VRVVEAAREEILLAGAMQLEQSRVTFARVPCFGIGEQVHFAGNARERRHHRAAGVVFDDELRDENRICEIRERVVEALARVHAAQSVKIGFGVGADEHSMCSHA